MTVIEDLRELNVGHLTGDMTRKHGRSTTKSSRTGAKDTTTAPSPAERSYRQDDQPTNRSAATHGGTPARQPRPRRRTLRDHPSLDPAICPGTPTPATDLRNCGIAELQLRPASNGNVVTATLTQSARRSMPKLGLIRFPDCRSIRGWACSSAGPARGASPLIARPHLPPVDVSLQRTASVPRL